MSIPTQNTKCGMCGCPFGVHYASFDGHVNGCTKDFGQRDGRCTCRGFAIVYKPVLSPWKSDTEMVEAYYNK